MTVGDTLLLNSPSNRQKKWTKVCLEAKGFIWKDHSGSVKPQILSGIMVQETSSTLFIFLRIKKRNMSRCVSFYVLAFDNHVSAAPTFRKLSAALQALTHNGVEARNLAPSRDGCRYAGSCLKISESVAAAVQKDLPTGFYLKGPFGRKTAKDFYRHGQTSPIVQ